MEPNRKIVRRVTSDLANVATVDMERGWTAHRSTCPDGQFWLQIGGEVHIRGESRQGMQRAGQLAYYAPREGAVRQTTTPGRAFGIQLMLSRLTSEEHDPRWVRLGHDHPTHLRHFVRVLSLAMDRHPDPHGMDEAVAEWIGSPVVTQESTIPGWMSKAEEVVAAEPDLPLAEVARLVGVVPAYLSAQYRRLRGQTMSRFRRQVRLQNALRLRGSLPLPLAAAEAGFYDASHFHRACQSEFGMRPGDLEALFKS